MAWIIECSHCQRREYLCATEAPAPPVLPKDWEAEGIWHWCSAYCRRAFVPPPRPQAPKTASALRELMEGWRQTWRAS